MKKFTNLQLEIIKWLFNNKDKVVNNKLIFIAKELNVHPSMITKTLRKINISSLHKLKLIFYNDLLVEQEFDNEKIKNLINLLFKNEIIIYGAGFNKYYGLILGKFLMKLGYNVRSITEFGEVKELQKKNSILFFLTISGSSSSNGRKILQYFKDNFGSKKIVLLSTHKESNLKRYTNLFFCKEVIGFGTPYQKEFPINGGEEMLQIIHKIITVLMNRKKIDIQEMVDLYNKK